MKTVALPGIGIESSPVYKTLIRDEALDVSREVGAIQPDDGGQPQLRLFMSLSPVLTPGLYFLVPPLCL